MGIDIIVNHPCEAKTQIGMDRILHLLKRKSAAEMVMNMMREQGDTRPASEIEFTRQGKTPEGVVEETINAQQAIDEVASALDRHAAACEHCPANAVRQPFGCWCYVNFPITSAQEQWLISRLPADLDSDAGKLLRKAIKDFNYNGGPVAVLRRQGQMFFEKRKAASRRWGGWFSGTTISSDQPLHMMFFVGPIQPSHAAMLAYFLGLLPQDLGLSEFVAMMNDPAAMKAAFLLPDETDHSPELRGYGEFLRALVASSVLQVEIEIEA